MTTDKKIINHIMKRCQDHLEKELKTDDEPTIALGMTMRLLVIQMAVGGYLEGCFDSGVINEDDRGIIYSKFCEKISERILACETRPARA